MKKNIDTIKAGILSALRARQISVTVEHPQAQKLLYEVITDHPDLQVSIDKIQTGSLLGLGNRFTIAYNDTVVPLEASLCAENEAGLEKALHTCIEHYWPIAAIAVPKTMDLHRAYHSFMVEFGSYYSNLISIQYAPQAFSFSPNRCALFTFQYRIGRVKLNMMERAVDEEVVRLSHLLFCHEMLPETKAYTAHNYLAKTVTYWLKEDANPLEKSYMQSAYGALINHRCVCQGYAEAFKRLMDSQGIICDVLCGKIRGSEEYHAWNAISFDGKQYYHVDVTWDSGGPGGVKWTYFCRSDAHMNPTRIWTRRSGVICSSEQDIAAIAQKQLASQRTTFRAKGVDSQYF